jgi:hypothetical protein
MSRDLCIDVLLCLISLIITSPSIFTYGQILRRGAWVVFLRGVSPLWSIERSSRRWGAVPPFRRWGAEPPAVPPYIILNVPIVYNIILIVREIVVVVVVVVREILILYE